MGPHGSHDAVRHAGEQAFPEHFVRPRRHNVLPSVAVPTLEIVNVTDLWPGTVCERSPRWWNEIPDSIQLMGCVTGSSHDGSVRASLQLSNELTCHIWVPIVNHRETVRPTCPEGWHSQTVSASEANPSKNEGQCGGLPDLTTAHAKVNVKDAPKALPNVLIDRAYHSTTPGCTERSW